MSWRVALLLMIAARAWQASRLSLRPTRNCPAACWITSSEHGYSETEETGGRVPLSLAVDSDHENLKLELPSPSCKALLRK